MTLTAAAAAFAICGAILGVLADRLSVRWPAHEPDYRPRRFDWRTAVLAVSGAAVFGAIGLRWTNVAELAVLSVSAAALIVLLATDLDQRILPDVVTLPLIAFSLAVLIAGWSPLLAGKELALFSGIAAGIGAPLFLVVTDRLLHGDLGDGDVKLAVSIGLLTGVSLLITGLLVASIGFSVVLVGLMAVGRLGMRSAVPFGPVLIFGAFVAIAVGP